MDYSKINQTELDFNCGIGIAKLNIYTGRLLYECPSLLIGANSFQIGSSLIYNNNYSNLDFNGKKLGIGNGWKINLQQHLFPYKNSYALEGFSEIDEDYVYIDSAWGVHKFKKYKSSNGYDYRSVYYDESGTGLRLSLGKDTYPEIYDGNNNIIISGSSNTITTGSGQEQIHINGYLNTIATDSGVKDVTIQGNGNSYSSGDSADNIEIKGNSNSVITLGGENKISIKGNYSKQIYKIKLDANGGEITQEELIFIEGSEIILPTPERSGYEFAGWFVDLVEKNTVVVESASKEFVGVTSNSMVLYAGWKRG